jgi:hypothetical protein
MFRGLGFNLPQRDEPRICYCLGEQDANRPKTALRFLIPISRLVPLLEFNHNDSLMLYYSL